MKDDRLPVPSADLMLRRAVAGYPTNFAAMSRTHFDAITTGGAQLMRTVLPMHLNPSQH
ncbi:hypothetical protein [Streptomyces sp. NPDC021212]|uniref:hypothetical protein n=1 Tax=Streptomyces sp. NPDC021212 TaxID=3365118 RepID=UPI0037B2BD7A